MIATKLLSSRAGEFVLCVFIVPCVILAVLWIPLQVSGLGATADFIQFYSAGAVVAGGAAPQLYDLAVHSEILRQFTHPPFEAILYALFAFFSYATAFRLWTLLSLSSLGLIFFLLRPYGSAFGLSERLLLLCAVFYPVFSAIVQGQDSLLVLLAFTLAFFSLKQDRYFWAGVWLGAGLIKPQLALPFALLLVFQGYWKIITGLATAAAVLTLLSVLVFGPAVLVQYPSMLFHMNEGANASAFHLVPQTMPNLRGMLALLFSKTLPPHVVMVLCGVLSAALFVWVCRAQRVGGSFDLSFSFALVGTLLISFHLLIHDLSLVLLPMFLFLNYLHGCESRSTTSYYLRVSTLPMLFLSLLISQLVGYRNFSVAGFSIVGLPLAIYATQRKIGRLEHRGRGDSKCVA